ncbi:MAG: 3-dehydro-L-gulonate 2-dehydrogenase [Acidobacteriaceae bacterium]|nr:3-dehydro-L-gulonate 2-dehydrogenase [Acidobacteriaceae bacterium]
MVRIPFDELKARVTAVLTRSGMDPQRAALSGELTAGTDRDGVRTHGIARLPRFLAMAREGAIDLKASPTTVASFGSLERWDGHYGPGNLAAYAAMSRACALALEHGVGCVAMARSSHWQRAGTYGWLAAEQGCAALCWTNTIANLPPWGSAQPALGNNPLVFAVPRGDGRHIVLDFAMSQFSYGTLEKYQRNGQQLPFPGGFDEEGRMTTDPAAIQKTYRALPIGLWKGSGLSFVLDALAGMLSGGKITSDLGRTAKDETGVSQIFLAVSPGAVSSFTELDSITARAIDSLHSVAPLSESDKPRYPGESVLRIREENLQQGVAIEDPVWAAFLELEANVSG